MSVLVAAAIEAGQVLRRVPWQVWAIAALIAAFGLYGCQQYRRGEEAAAGANERKQQEQADAARTEVDRVLRGDRSRVMQFDRD